MNVSQTASSIRDESRLVAEMRRLKSQRSPRATRIAKALDVLEKAKSARVRNAAAVALADLRAYKAKERLINLLTRPHTMESRGSLLYALDQLGADLPLSILATIIMGDAYEAREEALTFLVKNRIECTADEFADARATLEAASRIAHGEKLEATQRALKLLRGYAGFYVNDKPSPERRP